MRKIVVALLLLLCAPASAQIVSPFRIALNGSLQPAESRLNLLGTGLTCADNAGTRSSDCTFSGLQLSYVATLGTQSIGIFSQTSSTVLLERFTPNDAGSTSYYRGFSDSSNGGGRMNQIFYEGWNLGSTGSPVTAGEGAVGIGMEQYYVGAPQMELHLGVYVDPGNTTHRLFSCLLNLGSPYATACYQRATTINISTGTTANDDNGGIKLSATKTLLESPDNLQVISQDAAGTMTIYAGTAGHTQDTLVTLDPGGDFIVAAKRGFFGTVGSSTGQIGWGAGFTQMQSPDLNSQLYVNNVGPQVTANGVYVMNWLSNKTIARVPVVPDTDSTQSIGGPDARFLYGGFGAPVASRPTCDEPHRGDHMTVFAPSGASDTVQECMKDHLDAYGWVVVGTAP